MSADRGERGPVPAWFSDVPVSADQPLTGDDLATIKARVEAAINPPRCICSAQGGSVYSSGCPRHDRHAPGYAPPFSMDPSTTLRLVAEIERLREERAAIDLLDWPGEAHRLQAALHFARGTIEDLSRTVERLEGERG